MKRGWFWEVGVKKSRCLPGDFLNIEVEVAGFK